MIQEEAVKKAKEMRQSIGVDLYGLQQQLARQQALVEASNDNFNTVKNYRQETERGLQHYRHQHKETDEKLKRHHQHCKCFFNISGSKSFRIGQSDKTSETNGTIQGRIKIQNLCYQKNDS